MEQRTLFQRLWGTHGLGLVVIIMIFVVIVSAIIWDKISPEEQVVEENGIVEYAIIEKEPPCIKVSTLRLSKDYVMHEKWGYLDEGSIFHEPNKSFVGYRVSYLDKKGKETNRIFAKTEKEIEQAINYLLDSHTFTDEDSIANLYNNKHYCK